MPRERGQSDRPTRDAGGRGTTGDRRGRLDAPRTVRYGLAAAYAAFLLSASVARPPGSGPPPVILPFGTDTWLHALSYFLLAALIAYAVRPRTGRGLVAVAVLAAGYGAGIEVVQAFLPFRSFELLDAAANAVGAAVAAGVYRVGGSRRSVAPGTNS